MICRTNDCPPKRQREEMCRDPSVWTVVPGALLLVGCVGTICKQNICVCDQSSKFHIMLQCTIANPRTFSFSGIRDAWRASHRSKTSLWTLASTSAGPAAASSAAAVEFDEKHREACWGEADTGTPVHTPLLRKFTLSETYALGCAITERPRIAWTLAGTEDDMEAPLRTSRPRRLAAAAVERTATSMVERGGQK